MKILDKYILKSFLITFTSVFVILFFIFILQGVWLFIADLAGKDLDFIIIIKFLGFYAPTIVPLVLPLSVLLASIMTFGSFSENYEFAAMKSSGISLQRAMKFLTIFILLLSLVAFIFSNNVIPAAQYEFVNLRKNIIQQKPAMAIVEGQFNQIGFTNIKVSKKTGDRGQFLEDIILHRKNKSGNGSGIVILAKKGILSSDESENLLNLELFDGHYYEDIFPKKYEEQIRVPFAKSSFKKYILSIDLGKFDTSEAEDDKITNTNTMLNVNELNITIDSLQKNYSEDRKSFSENITQRNTSSIHNLPNPKFNEQANDSIAEDVFSLFSETEKRKILDLSINNVTSLDFTIQNSKSDLEYKKKNINKHWIAIHEKFMLAFSCILMFFIGAPLGAIIRKGGLGLPMVFAILIFIIFHFVNTFGKKLAQEDGITPFLGTWMASLLLLPFAILLTYRATNDMGITIDFDWLIDPIMKLFSKKGETTSNFKKEIVSLENIIVNQNDAFVNEIVNKEDAVLINLVRNSEQFNYNSNQRLIALKILENRGITQQELLEKNSLYNENFLKLNFLNKEYSKLSKITLVFYILSFLISSVVFSNNFFIIAFGILFIFLHYLFIYKSSQILEEISKITNRNNFTSIYVALLFGFPFFIFIYLYNKKQLKESLAEFNN